MATLNVTTTKESTNYARLCRLLIDVGSKALRDIFDGFYTPGNLHDFLSSSSVQSKLESLRKRKILHPTQWSKLFPAVPTTVSSADFDITLLSVLLRNICGLSPPASTASWDKPPPPADKCREADVVRVRDFRNTVYAHVEKASVDDATFGRLWHDIGSAIVRLRPDYADAIEQLRTTCMDPEMEERNALLRRMILSEKKCELPEVASNVHGHRKEVDKIVEALKGKTSKPAAGVLVSGVAGVGKSTVAVQAGHRLKNEFKDIVKFCSLRGAYKGGSQDDGVLKKILNVCVPVHRQSSEYPKHDLLNWCRRLDYELVLIVDNAEDAIGDRGDYTFVNLLSEMRMRSADKIQFVVTSRRSDIETVETIQNIQFVKIALDPLDVEESIEVLKNGANLTSDIDADTKGELREIAQLCENIPLALRLAGPLLAKESECTFEELKQNLDKNATRALDVKPMMQIAFEKLEESLQRALVSLSVFPKSFKRDAALAILGDDRAAALTNLKKRCLIQKQDDRYLIHLLIRDYAKEIGKRDEFRQIRSEGKQGFLKHFLSLVLKNAKKYWGKDACKESLVLFYEERINLEYTLRTIARDLKKFETCSEVESLINEIQQVAPYIEYCVHFKLYHEFLTGLHDQLCQSQEKITKQAEILCLLYHASRKQSGQNKDNSESFILKAKELRDKNASKFKLDRLSEAFFLSHYGRYLSQDRNKRKQAQPLLMQSKSIYEEETPKSDSTIDQGRILVQMGHNAKKEKLIRERAIEYYREAICFRSKYYGRHFLTAFAHKDLADYYLSIKDFIEAEKSYMEAIEVLENMEMTGQKEAVPVYKNLGWCCEKRDKIDQARKELEKGRDVADNTIEGSFKWKVEINTYLALLLYKHYSEDKSTADKLSNDVFNMSKELNMDKWSGKNELEKFYNRK